MKKILTIITIALGITFALGYGTYQVLDNVDNFNAENPDSEVTTDAPPEDDESPYATELEEYTEQTKDIGGQIFELELTDATTEGEIIDIMHKMTHQKVKAEDKWGAVPMSSDTVKQVLAFLKTTDFAATDEMIKIAEKWQNGEFETVDHDHNYFWDWQGGTVGRAYGILSPAEEEVFVKNNFQ